MKKDYRRTKATVSMINYHFVFCPRYRRKLFLVDGFEARFKELVTQICEQSDIVILAMECHIDHCHLFVNAPPTLSAAEIMKIIKGTTGRILLLSQKNYLYVFSQLNVAVPVQCPGSSSAETLQVALVPSFSKSARDHLLLV